MGKNGSGRVLLSKKTAADPSLQGREHPKRHGAQVSRGRGYGSRLQVYRECANVAASYPDYMRFIPRKKVSLTNREAQVLSLLCSGLSMDETGESLAECGLRLAQFVVDYGDYIEEGTRPKVFDI